MIMDDYGIMDDYATSLLEKMLRVKCLKTLHFRVLHFFPKFPLIFPSCVEKKKNTLHTQDTQTPQPWKSKDNGLKGFSVIDNSFLVRISKQQFQGTDIF